jgi:hypothetical protein
MWMRLRPSGPTARPAQTRWPAPSRRGCFALSEWRTALRPHEPLGRRHSSRAPAAAVRAPMPMPSCARSPVAESRQGLAVRSRIGQRCTGGACKKLSEAQRGNGKGRSCDGDGTMWRGRSCGMDGKAKSRVHGVRVSGPATRRGGIRSIPFHLRGRPRARRSLQGCRPRPRRHQAGVRRGGGHRRHRLRLARGRRSASVLTPPKAGAGRDGGRRVGEKSGG